MDMPNQGPAGSGPAAAKARCAITGRETAKKDLVLAETIRPPLLERIRRDHPGIEDNARISRPALNRYRSLYVAELLKEEHGEFGALEQRVAQSIADQDTIAENTEADFEEERTPGERLSDLLAGFGGSWKFLIAFALVLIAWIAGNLLDGASRAFDPYPFILLNLILSCLAAVQAPIIMMSQKRQEAKDRRRSLNDYQVNLKAELEVRHLHEKLDHLITRQWQRLAEIQEIQLEIMQESRKAR